MWIFALFLVLVPLCGRCHYGCNSGDDTAGGEETDKAEGLAT